MTRQLSQRLSSAKNKEGMRDPEMRQAKKGNQWRFGMKEHIGVDAGSGLVRSVAATAANVHDVTVVQELVREGDGVIYGDSGYLGGDKRDEVKNDSRFDGIEWKINRRPSSIKAHLRGRELRCRREGRRELRAAVRQ